MNRTHSDERNTEQVQRGQQLKEVGVGGTRFHRHTTSPHPTRSRSVLRCYPGALGRRPAQCRQEA